MLWFLLLLNFTTCFNPNLLSSELQKTKKLISLYTQKQSILQKLYIKHFNQSYQYSESKAQEVIQITAFQTRPMQYKLLNQWNLQIIFFPPNYFLIQNWICDLKSSQIYYFDGQPFIVEKNKLTFIKNNKVKIMNIFNEEHRIQDTQYFSFKKETLVQKAMWHRSLSSKQGENVLIIIDSGILVIKNRTDESNLVLLQKQKVFDVFELNQYNIQFVSNYRIGVLNIRNKEIIQNRWYKNLSQGITEEKNNSNVNKHQKISLCSCKIEDSIYVLLNNGEILKYVNQKIKKTYFVPEIAAWIQQKVRPKITIYLLSLYFFVYDLKSHELIIFNYTLGNFFFNQKITFNHSILSNEILDDQSKVYFFIKNDSINLLYSQRKKSFYYDLMLSTIQSSTERKLIYKFAFAILVIIAVLSYRCSRNINTKTKIQFFKKKRQQSSKKQTQKIKSSQNEDNQQFNLKKQNKTN